MDRPAASIFHTSPDETRSKRPPPCCSTSVQSPVEPISTARTPLESATRMSLPEPSGIESTGAGMRQTVSTSVESAGGRSVSRRQTTGSDGLGCNGGPQAAKATVATASLLSIALGTRDAHCALYALE